MSATTVRLDAKTKKKLDAYCKDTGKKMSEAFRVLLNDALSSYENKKTIGFIESVGVDSLMINEKRAIRASIENTLILRKLLGSLIDSNTINLSEIDNEVSQIMRSGWHYDNELKD